jgi:TPR repeat protein
VALYQQAADQSYAKAQYFMGVAYYYGQGVETDTKDPEDYVAAVQWYQLAGDQGYAAAQSTLGFCFQVGRGCNLSIEQAEKYFRLAAAQGDSYASAKLGSLQDFMVAKSSAT